MSPAEMSRSATTVSPPNSAVPVNENGTLSHRRSDDATRTFLPSAEREICRIARGASGFHGMVRSFASSVPWAEDSAGFLRSRIPSISPWIRWPIHTGIGTTFSTVERDSVPANVTFAVPGSRWIATFASDASSRITSGSIDNIPGVFRRESEMSGPSGHASVASTTTAPPFSRENVDPVTVKGALGAYGSGTPRRADAHFAASTPTTPWRDAVTWSSPFVYPRSCTSPWHVVSRRDASTSVKESSSGRMRNRPRGIVTGPGSRGVSTSRFSTLPPASNLHSPGSRNGPSQDSVAIPATPRTDRTGVTVSRIPSSEAIQGYTSSSAMRAVPPRMEIAGVFPRSSRPVRPETVDPPTLPRRSFTAKEAPS